MRRVLAATVISILWMTLFALSLFAQEEIPVWVDAPNFTIPPFEPPAGALITVTTDQDNLSDNGDCSLREAIQAANSDTAVDGCPAGNGDDLILLAAASYRLVLEGRRENENSTGDLDIRSTLIISGVSSERTFIDANLTDRVLHILTGTVEIRGVTIWSGLSADGEMDGCSAPGIDACPDGEPGGGIYNWGTLTMVDVTVQNNTAGKGNYGPIGGGSNPTGVGGRGGGIANTGILQIYRSRVIGNMAGSGGASAKGGDGGGIDNEGLLLATEITITDNQSGSGGPAPRGSGPYGRGGGISNRGTLTITNSQIFTNSTILGGGGGLYNAGDAWLFVSAIGYNYGGYQLEGGGGIANVSNLLLDRCVVYANQSGLGEGGGLYNTGTVSLTNCTISSNTSGTWSGYLGILDGSDGGGIFNTGTLLLQNATVASNQTGAGYCPGTGTCRPGGSGGGIANDGGAVTIHNSIIAGNSVADGGSGPDCTGIVTSQGPNLIRSAEGCTIAGAGDDILDQHAFLGPLADNPSSGSGQAAATLTHALLPYSPALDAGSCADLTGTPILTDQRGEPRPQGAGCDLGAFESGLSRIPLPEINYLPVIQR